MKKKVVDGIVEVREESKEEEKEVDGEEEKE